VTNFQTEKRKALSKLTTAHNNSTAASSQNTNSPCVTLHFTYYDYLLSDLADILGKLSWLRNSYILQAEQQEVSFLRSEKSPDVKMFSWFHTSWK
jgi:predicted secreted protein